MPPIRSSKPRPTVARPTLPSVRRSPLVGDLTLTPSMIDLGIQPLTDARVGFALGRLKTNVYLLAGTGDGKTSVMGKIHRALAFAPNPTLAYDYVGTGFDEMKNFVAFTGTVLKIIEELHPEERLHLAEKFMQRYAFVFLSDRSRNETGIDLPIRIDLLKRRFINNRWESTAEVLSRVMRMFDVRFASDMNMRVQFQRIAKVLFTVMISAGIPLKRWQEVLRGTAMDEVRRNQESSGTGADEFVRSHTHELSRIHAMLGGKSTREFDLATNSTVNALWGYAPGTILGEFFSSETFDPASVVFGGNRLFISTDIADTNLRREAFLALYALEGALAAARALNVRRFARLVRFVDEIAWVPESLPTDLAQIRNLGISVVLAHQNSAQWQQHGMPFMKDMVPSLFPTRLEFRPTTEEDARRLAIATKEFDPAGVFIEKKVISTAAGETISEAVSETWNEMLSSTGSESGGTSRPEMLPGDEAPPRVTTTDGFVHATTSGRGTGGGSTTTNGRSTTETIAQVLYRIPIDEQVTEYAHRLMRRAKHEATLIEDGRGREVALAKPPYYPPVLFGVAIREHYDRLHDAHWSSRGMSAPVDVPLHIAPAGQVPPPSTIDLPVDIEPNPPAPTTEPAPTPTVVSEVSLADAALLSSFWLRHTTGQHVMLVRPTATYDSAMRALAKLSKAGLVVSVRPPVAKGGGSAPILYNLTEKGARRLAELGLADIEPAQRLARSVLAKKRAIEEGQPTLLRHQRFVGWMIALLLADARRADPDVKVRTVAWDPAITVNLRDIHPALSSAARDRVSLDDGGSFVYKPDAVVVLDGDVGSEVFLVEVETNAGDQPAGPIGEAKSACIAAVTQQLRSSGMIGTTAFHPATPLTAVVWHRRTDAATKFLLGARALTSALHVDLPIFVTDAEKLPLWLPSGTAKRDVRPALERLTGLVRAPIFAAPTDPSDLLSLPTRGAEQGNA